MGLVMRDRGRDMRDRGEGPRPLRCQTQKSVHLPGDPFILVVNNLTPGSHVKIPDIQDGQLPVDNILVYGEFRKKGNSQVLSQQADDKFRVANLQKGVYLLALGRQILVQDETVASMNKDAILFAMANPVPEIMPDLAKAAGARVVGTGRSDFPNQVNNVVVFPGIFKGALEGRASAITEEMKLAAAEAIAGLVDEKDLSDENILPEAFDPRVADVVSSAVKDHIRK